MEENINMEQNLSMEEAFKSLDEIVEQLENKDISLEETFAMYQKGMELLKECSSRIDTVEKKMQQLNEDGTLQELESR